MHEISGQIQAEHGNTVAVKRTFANIASGTTDGPVVAAVSTKRIRVLAVALQPDATATDCTFNSASAAISALFATLANTPTVLPYSQHGWFQTKSGEALTLTTGVGSAVGVQVIYAEVD